MFPPRLGLVLMCLVLLSPLVNAELVSIETADGSKNRDTRELVQWTHTRLIFNKSLKRVAVGQDSTLELEVLDKNEVLALAKDVGRTSIMVWYENGNTESFLFSVVEDLTVLRTALGDIHPAIRIELAPDRAALVLRGQVPNIKYRAAAESAARNYLSSGRSGNSADSAFLQNPIVSNLLKDRDTRALNPAANAAIINLIKVDTLPQETLSKIRSAIKKVGGPKVKVERLQKGDLNDDNSDTILLTGTVKNQVVLTRVLNIVSSLYGGSAGPDRKAGEIRALTNESGGLLSGRSNGGSNLNSSGARQTSRQVSGGRQGVSSNIGRSKIVSLAGGQILSMIEVADLPQVRVAVQIFEVNQSKLKSWRSGFGAANQGFVFGENISAPKNIAAVQRSLESALQLFGTGSNLGLQLAKGDYSLDWLFSVMEQQGIARNLSRPTITVLSGERAVFRAGGEVPVPTAFASSGLSNGDNVGVNASGVFSGTEFKSFGIELSVEAMVDERDDITLKLNPSISLPDTVLTQNISDATGTNLNASAFNVRSLSTTARLMNGETLILGGLMSRDQSNNQSGLPGQSRVSALKALGHEQGRSESDKELVILVKPTILRRQKKDMSIWQFSHSETTVSRTSLSIMERSR